MIASIQHGRAQDHWSELPQLPMLTLVGAHSSAHKEHGRINEECIVVWVGIDFGGRIFK